MSLQRKQLITDRLQTILLLLIHSAAGIYSALYCCSFLYALYISTVHITPPLLHNIFNYTLKVFTVVCGIICIYVDDAVIEKEGSVRLVGGPQPHEGLVEMFLFGQWGTVCRPNHSYKWTLSNANTICQHLGYAGAAAALSRAMYAFQKGSGPMWYLNVEDCAGNKVNLTQCSRSVRSGLCPENEVVGVICTGRLCQCQLII